MQSANPKSKEMSLILTIITNIILILILNLYHSVVSNAKLSTTGLISSLKVDYSVNNVCPAVDRGEIEIPNISYKIFL